MAQLNYSYQPGSGIAGGLLDISPYRIDSRVNGEKVPGKLKYGMGAVCGSKPGVNVAVPNATSEQSDFEGIVMTGYTNELSMDGEVVLREYSTVGLLRYGSAWVRTVADIEPAYGDPLYLVVDGADAGLFTNDSNEGIAINGRFRKESGIGDVAAVDIYDQPV